MACLSGRVHGIGWPQIDWVASVASVDIAGQPVVEAGCWCCNWYRDVNHLWSKRAVSAESTSGIRSDWFEWVCSLGKYRGAASCLEECRPGRHSFGNIAIATVGLSLSWFDELVKSCSGQWSLAWFEDDPCYCIEACTFQIQEGSPHIIHSGLGLFCLFLREIQLLTCCCVKALSLMNPCLIKFPKASQTASAPRWFPPFEFPS